MPNMNPKLAGHLSFAIDRFRHFASEISAAMTKYQLKLADRQCRMAEISQRVQDSVVMLVTALWGNRQKSEASIMAADILCQDLARKLMGERPSDQYFKDCGKLADVVINGGYEALTGSPIADILMPYDQK